VTFAAVSTRIDGHGTGTSPCRSLVIERLSPAGASLGGMRLVLELPPQRGPSMVARNHPRASVGKRTCATEDMSVVLLAAFGKFPKKSVRSCRTTIEWE
jgi:hypothetical protein